MICSDVCNIERAHQPNRFSAQREDHDLNNYLSRKQAESDKVTGVYVHKKCRRDYNNHTRISPLKPDSELKKLKIETRKLTENFSWLLHCFLYGMTCAQDPKHPNEVTVTILQLLK